MLLGVNIDHVATVRQARGTSYPDPLEAALEALAGGADFITVHLREDRRHIQDRDLERLIDGLSGRINLELAATDDMVAIACRLRPSDCCLVPERREELTTEGGLDVRAQQAKIQTTVARLRDAGCRVSLFVDARRSQLEAARQVGADVVEIHTGHYAAATAAARDKELERVRSAAQAARAMGLSPNAGHGLHLENVGAIAAIAAIRELNIGHALVARALFVGMREAVREMKQRIAESDRK